MAKRMSAKEQLKARLRESQDRAAGGKSFMKDDLSEKGVVMWKPDEGDHEIDIIPYVAGPNDPNTPEGDYAYVLEVFAHYGVGADEDGVVLCLAKTFNQPCPICEHRRVLAAEGADEDAIRSLNPSRRALYNVLCYDSEAQEDKGVQVFAVSHWLFTKHLEALAKTSRRQQRETGEPFVYYMDQEEGKTVIFSKEGKGLGMKFMGMKFADRTYAISDEDMDAAHVLDELIHVPSYNEAYKMYWGDDAEDKGTQEASPKRGRGKSKDGGTGKAQVKKETGRERKSRGEKKEEKELYTVNENECPDGHDFGEDIDQFEDCEKCPKEIWKACSAANTEEPDPPDEKEPEPKKEEKPTKRSRRRRR